MKGISGAIALLALAGKCTVAFRSLVVMPSPHFAHSLSRLQSETKQEQDTYGEEDLHIVFDEHGLHKESHQKKTHKEPNPWVVSNANTEFTSWDRKEKRKWPFDADEQDTGDTLFGGVPAPLIAAALGLAVYFWDPLHHLLKPIAPHAVDLAPSINEAAHFGAIADHTALLTPW